jgi:hypothetical protein
MPASSASASSEERLRKFLTPGAVSTLVDVGEKIGAGGFSVVRQGKLKSTGEAVAVKVILPSQYATTAQRLAALHEVMVLRSLASLKSPHILRLVSAHEDRNPQTGQLRLSLVTELVKGGELFDEILALQHYSERDASRLMARLAETLTAVHGAGVLHRDLKPENVLLRTHAADAEPVLADFGLALMADEAESARHAGIVGTSSYLAPEIILRQDYSPASDTWSLGVLTYILLGGYHPFSENDPHALNRCITSASFVFHEDAWAHVSADAQDLISKVLVADPKKRLSLADFLKHRWISNYQELPTLHMSATANKLKVFNARRKIRAAVRLVMFGVKSLALAKDSMGIKSTDLSGFSVDTLHAAFNRYAHSRSSGAGASPSAPAGSAESNRVVSLAEFRKIAIEVGVNDTELVDRLFAAFDIDASGDLDWRELCAGVTAQDDATVFSIFDANGDGFVTRNELVPLLVHAASNSPSDAATNASELDELEKRMGALFEKIDSNHDGRISLDEFRAALRGDAREAILSPLKRFSSSSGGLVAPKE